MKNTIAFQLWRVLLPAEQHLFLHFLENPFHNRRNDVQALARLLADAPSNEWDRLDKQAVFTTIFPGAPFDNLRLNYTCSFFVQRLESFLVWQELEAPGMREALGDQLRLHGDRLGRLRRLCLLGQGGPGGQPAAPHRFGAEARGGAFIFEPGGFSLRHP